MTSRYWLWALAVAAAVLIAAPAAAQDAKKDAKKPDKPAPAKADEPVVSCVVTDGEPIDWSVFVRHRGKRVYFCCDDCVEKFNADPEKYAEGIKKQWAANKPLRIQVKCPVTGGAIDRKFMVETKLEDIYFASAEAQEKFRKDQKPYAAKLDECFTYQTMCPTSAREIDPAAALEVDGRKVYFCCESCIGDFKKDQASYMKKVDEQVKANEAAFKKRTAPAKKP